MAKLSAHGTEIGRIEFSSHRKVYMSDGAILKDSGNGWKLFGKVKLGCDPNTVFEREKQIYADRLEQRPALAEYVRFIKFLAPLSRRRKLIISLQMMPDNPDGIWSNCCDGFDDNIEADLDDIVRLCTLYSESLSEAQRFAESQTA